MHPNLKNTRFQVYSADTGYRITYGRFNIPLATNQCIHNNVGTTRNGTDNSCISAVGMGVQRCKDSLRTRSRNSHNDLSFICDFEWIYSQHRCGASDAFPDREICFPDPDTHTALSCHLIDCTCKPSTRRVFHRMNGTGVQHLFHHPPEWRNIGLDLCTEVKTLPVCHNRYPMITKSSGYDDHISGNKTIVTNNLPGDTNSGSIDNDAVQCSFLHNLGIPCHKICTRFTECIIHGSNNPCEVIDFKSFFYDHSAGKCDRPTTHHCKIVYRSADCDPADIASGKENGADYM